MLEITIPGSEQFNEATNEFYNVAPQKLHLEHSLASVAEWESKWHIPFMSKEQKTAEQTIDYVRCMSLDKNIDLLVYNAIPKGEMDRINAYIDEPMTATTFVKDQNPPSRDIVTSEIIYYWMTELNIPMECQYWHLNRLLTLVRVCGIKKSPSKKMGKRDLMSRNKALNKSRRSRLKSRG